jgi:phytoene dehydrogenase-like protein
MTERWTQSPKVAVVGGGLAGLAAGSALAESGFRVTLFERRAYLGGRASSYQHPGTGEVVDNCQHVLPAVPPDRVLPAHRVEQDSLWRGE